MDNNSTMVSKFARDTNGMNQFNIMAHTNVVSNSDTNSSNKGADKKTYIN